MIYKEEKEIGYGPGCIVFIAFIITLMIAVLLCY